MRIPVKWNAVSAAPSTLHRVESMSQIGSIPHTDNNRGIQLAKNIQRYRNRPAVDEAFNKCVLECYAIEQIIVERDLKLPYRTLTEPTLPSR